MVETILDPLSRSILLDVLRESVLSKGKLDASDYRVDHDDWIELLNQLEWKHYLKRDDNKYRVAFQALSEIDNDDAKVELGQCEEVFKILREHYKKPQTRNAQIKIADLAENLNFTNEQTIQTVRYLMDVSSLWFGGSAGDLDNIDTYWFKPGEHILTNKTFSDLVNKVREWQKPGESLKLPNSSNITAFVSYSTVDKIHGAKVKHILKQYGIRCFLAHEDLEVSEEWKIRILEELASCDIFIPLLSKAFKLSDWASQEIGIVSGRNDILIIPLSIDNTVPYGFIAHLQGKLISRGV